MTFLQQIEQNAAEIRRLLAVPSHIDITLTLTALRKALDLEFANIAQPPIGAIIAWHKNAALDVPSLPPNWVECSGGVLNDPESPLNGMTIPNLNDGDFLRGATQSGGGGGAATHIHNFSATAAISAESAGAVSGADISVSLDSHDHAVVGTTDPTSSLPPTSKRSGSSVSNNSVTESHDSHTKRDDRMQFLLPRGCGDEVSRRARSQPRQDEGQTGTLPAARSFAIHFSDGNAKEETKKSETAAKMESRAHRQFRNNARTTSVPAFANQAPQNKVRLQMRRTSRDR